MDRVSELNRTVFRVAVVAGIGALILVAGFSVASALATTGPASIECDIDVAVYGDQINCAAAGDDVVAILWPDGAVTAREFSIAPKVVGAMLVSATDNRGNVLASTTIDITPDVDLQCNDSEEKIVFQLAASDTRERGWDYVFTNSITGAEVRPGDPDHPNGGSETGLERIELDRANSTGLCRVVSQAGEDFDGEYQVTLISEFEGTLSYASKIIGPASRTQWAGVQPAELTGSVTVNGVEASERQGVYLSGCS